MIITDKESTSNITLFVTQDQYNERLYIRVYLKTHSVFEQKDKAGDSLITRIDFKDSKISSFILMIVLVFFVMDFIGYKVLHDQIILDHEKDSHILVNDLNHKTSDLLTSLLHEYDLQREGMLQRHRQVMKRIDATPLHPLDIDLHELHEMINLGHATKPYNINITDTELIIRNSTLDTEIGFDTSFAREIFDGHLRDDLIGYCGPLFEKSTESFFSFTDSYILKDRDEKIGILNISYKYKDRSTELLELQKAIDDHGVIKDAQVFTIDSSDFIHDIFLKEYKAYKPTLQEFYDRIKDGQRLLERLGGETKVIDSFIKDGTHYKSILISTNSNIFDDTKIIFSMLLDETDYLYRLKELNIWISFITLLGLMAILIIYRLRGKETRLSEQDQFIQSAMHEIKTPLSIMTLNNGLRELESGRDEYSEEIDSAIKSLKISYDDMNFAMNKGKMTYPVESLCLKSIIEERVRFFQTVARSNSKVLLFHSNSECEVMMSSIELTRLIDNNISNAIKYADLDSTITITQDKERVSFHDFGTPIKDTKKIFHRYFRENDVIGGYGLGLSIVNDVLKRYKIKTEVISHKESGTSFNYTFNCHSDDITSVKA